VSRILEADSAALSSLEDLSIGVAKKSKEKGTHSDLTNKKRDISLDFSCKQSTGGADGQTG
jgi:hypothetical protein